MMYKTQNNRDSLQNIQKQNNLHILNNLLPMMLIFFCVGELAGTIIYCTGNIPGIIGFGTSFWSSRLGCTFIQTLVNSFSGVFLMLCCCFAAGICPFFQPVCAAIPAFRGIGIGIMLAELYADRGLTGIAATAVLIMPYSVASGLILAAGAKEAVIMSVGIFKSVYMKKNCSYHIDLKLYAAKFAFLASVLAAAALMDSFLTFFAGGIWA